MTRMSRFARLTLRSTASLIAVGAALLAGALLATIEGCQTRTQTAPPTAASAPVVGPSGPAVAVPSVRPVAPAQNAPLEGPAPDALAEGFVTPPDSAKPRTWWHWTNGNVTETGITKDLEWMKRVGIGGFQLVDVATGNGQVVEPKINFGTPEWYHAVKHSAELAKQLDLEMSIFSCAGWSEAGGPWVTPQMAMKRLVWSETDVAGWEGFRGQAGGAAVERRGGAGFDRGGTPSDPPFYEDSALIAYRDPRMRCRWRCCIRRRRRAAARWMIKLCWMTA